MPKNIKKWPFWNKKDFFLTENNNKKTKMGPFGVNAVEIPILEFSKKLIAETLSVNFCNFTLTWTSIFRWIKLHWVVFAVAQDLCVNVETDFVTLRVIFTHRSVPRRIFT